MRTLVLTSPDARRWALESVLRNAGYDVDFYDHPRKAGLAYRNADFGLVVVDEPDDGKLFASTFLGMVAGSGDDHPPILCLTGLPNVVSKGLGRFASMVHLVPSPIDGLILRMVFEDLGLPWGRVPASRPALKPPVPDRPWGRVGMKQGTVDAAGNVVEVVAPEGADGDDGDDEGAGEGATEDNDSTADEPAAAVPASE